MMAARARHHDHNNNNVPQMPVEEVSWLRSSGMRRADPSRRNSTRRDEAWRTLGTAKKNNNSTCRHSHLRYDRLASVVKIPSQICTTTTACYVTC